MRRRWGASDTVGLALIVVGLGLFFTGMPWLSALALVGGAVVIFIARVH